MKLTRQWGRTDDDKTNYEQLALSRAVIGGGKGDWAGRALCVCACTCVCILNRVVRERFAEKVKFQITVERGEGGSHASI